MVKLPVFPYIPKLRSSTPSLQAKAAPVVPVVPVPPQVGLDGLVSHVEEHIWIDLSISYVQYIYI